MSDHAGTDGTGVGRRRRAGRERAPGFCGSGITGLVQQALSEGAARGEFNGDPESGALHIVTVTRGLAVLERAFGDEAQLRKIAGHTVDLVLVKR